MSDQNSRTSEALWPERPPCIVPLPGGRELDAGSAPLVMGILNVTPDSFSDGGKFFRPDLAAERGREMEEVGADVIDVGGESTRPGSEPVSAEEEKRRVLPVIEELAAESTVPVSIDTQKAEVAEEALRKGARIINDVSGLRNDPDMVHLAAETGAAVCLMHMQGRPRNMQENPEYDDVVTDIISWLEGRLRYATENGVDRNRIFVDPGFGFGKTPQHNLEILRRLHEFQRLDCPVMVGTSRKSTLGAILKSGTEERLNATLATVATSVMSGVHMVRVHDPGPAREVALVCEAIRQGMEWQG